MPPEPGWLDLRASDGERERVAEVLRGAVAEGRLSVAELEGRLGSVYALVTRRELSGLIADVSSDSLELVLRRPAGPPVRSAGTRRVFSIMGGASRRGHWQVAERCTVLNVMGGADIDLCDAEIPAAGTRIRVWSLMGGSEIRVPEDWRVTVSKFALMGGNDVRLDPQPPPGGGEIHIQLVSVMGGSKVRQGPKKRRTLKR